MGFPNLGALYLIALSARPSSKEGCPGTLVVLSPLRRMSIRIVELADALLGGVFYGPLKQTPICCSTNVVSQPSKSRPANKRRFAAVFARLLK